MRYLICILLILAGCTELEVNPTPPVVVDPPPVVEPVPIPEPPKPKCTQAVMTWRIPVQRENGDSLPQIEIGGFEIQGRINTEANFKTMQVINWLQESGLETFNVVITDLKAGIYFFRAYCFDSNGLYSSPSESKEIEVCDDGIIQMRIDRY